MRSLKYGCTQKPGEDSSQPETYHTSSQNNHLYRHHYNLQSIVIFANKRHYIRIFQGLKRGRKYVHFASRFPNAKDHTW